MAYSMLSSAAVVTSPAQATMVAPFTGLKSSSAFPVTRKANNDITSIVSNGGRVSCMQVNVTREFTVRLVFYYTQLVDSNRILFKSTFRNLGSLKGLNSMYKSELIFH